MKAEEILKSPDAQKIGWCLQIKMSPEIEWTKEPSWYPSLKNQVFDEQITLTTDQCLKVYQAIKSVLKQNILDAIQNDRMNLRDLGGLQMYSTYNDYSEPIEFTPAEAERLCAIINSVSQIKNEHQDAKQIPQKRPSLLMRLFKK